MRRALPGSLTWRIAALVALAVTALWLLAAAGSVALFSRQMNRVFDQELQATAQRILPIVLRDRAREMRAQQGNPPPRPERPDRPDRPNRPEGPPPGPRPETGDHVPRPMVSRLDNARDTVEFLIRSRDGEVILSSANSTDIHFPDTAQEGFAQDDHYRFYSDQARRFGIAITVAEPLTERRAVRHEIMLGMSAPLLVVIPLSLLAIFLAVRRSMAPVARLNAELARRGPQRLDPLSDTGLVDELRPIQGAVNALMERLAAAFASERSFAANAAHEMRTPVAGAIAQAQRLRTETRDPQAAARAEDIIATLKRLSRLSEKLMQLARAEGARLRLETELDLRLVAQMIIDDFRRLPEGERIALTLPPNEVRSDLDPDAFGILLRNLVENALRHGTPGTPVQVRLTAEAVLEVDNDSAPVPPETLCRLSDRFQRGDGAGDGTGLGLAIAHIIAERADGRLTLISPLPDETGDTTGDRAGGFGARFDAAALPHGGTAS